MIALAVVAVMLPTMILSVIQYRSLLELQSTTKLAAQESLRQVLYVWGYTSFPLTRTVDNHVAKLRQKVEDVPSEPKHVITVHRVGYKFVE